MKVSRTMTYAVQALLLLGQKRSGELVPCSRLSTEGQMPDRFLLQILRSLVNGGILQSSRGVDGGYRLAKPPEQITLLEVLEAVDGPLLASVPPLERMPDEVRDKLLVAFSDVANCARNTLKDVTLTDLLMAESDKAPSQDNPLLP